MRGSALRHNQHFPPPRSDDLFGGGHAGEIGAVRRGKVVLRTRFAGEEQAIVHRRGLSPTSGNCPPSSSTASLWYSWNDGRRTTVAVVLSSSRNIGLVLNDEVSEITRRARKHRAGNSCPLLLDDAAGIAQLVKHPALFQPSRGLGLWIICG